MEYYISPIDLKDSFEERLLLTRKLVMTSGTKGSPAVESTNTSKILKKTNFKVNANRKIPYKIMKPKTQKHQTNEYN